MPTSLHFVRFHRLHGEFVVTAQSQEFAEWLAKSASKALDCSEVSIMSNMKLVAFYINGTRHLPRKL